MILTRKQEHAAAVAAVERERMHGWTSAVNVTRARVEQYRPGAFNRAFEERILRVLRLMRLASLRCTH